MVKGAILQKYLTLIEIIAVRKEDDVLLLKKDFFGFLYFFCTIIDTDSSASDSTVSGDAGIESRTVAARALAVRRSNHSARSHLQTRLDLIHILG
jgi:hypothetical protein